MVLCSLVGAPPAAVADSEGRAQLFARCLALPFPLQHPPHQLHDPDTPILDALFLERWTGRVGDPCAASFSLAPAAAPSAALISPPTPPQLLSHRRVPARARPSGA
jgi:hypothetical protein